jgi:hypothetical protein
MVSVDSLPVEQKIAFRRKSIQVMQDLLELSALMIRVEDYQRGRENFFAPAHKIWFMFGGTIKRLSPELGNQIEPRFNSIDTTLEQQSPSHSSLVASLGELIQLVEAAVKISDENI